MFTYFQRSVVYEIKLSMWHPAKVYAIKTMFVKLHRTISSGNVFVQKATNRTKETLPDPRPNKLPVANSAGKSRVNKRTSQKPSTRQQRQQQQHRVELIEPRKESPTTTAPMTQQLSSAVQSSQQLTNQLPASLPPTDIFCFDEEGNFYIPDMNKSRGGVKSGSVLESSASMQPSSRQSLDRFFQTQSMDELFNIFDNVMSLSDLRQSPLVYCKALESRHDQQNTKLTKFKFEKQTSTSPLTQPSSPSPPFSPSVSSTKSNLSIALDESEEINSKKTTIDKSSCFDSTETLTTTIEVNDFMSNIRSIEDYHDHLQQRLHQGSLPDPSILPTNEKLESC